MKNQLIAANGSVKDIAEIPDDLKALYKTVWEISQRDVIDMAADRGAFIDQSQSLNLHIAAPSFAKLTSMHFYAWKKVSWLAILILDSVNSFHASVFLIFIRILLSGSQDWNVLLAY